MKQQVLAYSFLILGILALVLLIAVLIAAWHTVVVISTLLLWGVLTALSLAAIGRGVYLAAMGYLHLREKHLSIRHAAEQHALEQHLALTRVPADAQGNYAHLLGVHQLTSLPPGNAPKGTQRAQGSQREGTTSQEPPQLAAPPAAPPTFAALLAAREIVPYESESILGYSDGVPRKGRWAQLHSFLVLGISGSGKSSTVAYYVALAILHGAKLLLIDPDAEEEESLTARLAALSFAFLAPAGTTPAEAKRVLDVAERELASPGNYPVLWCVDEFSSIMRAGEKGLKGWGEIAERLAIALEDWAQRGRKRQRTVIVIGQIGKASRTGGTELRASMTATFVHRLPAQQARLVLDTLDAKYCPTLDVGEVIVLLANAAATYRMQIPYTDPQDMLQVTHLMSSGVSTSRFSPVSRHDTFPTGEGVEPPEATLETPPETALETAWQGKVRRVRAMRQQGCNQKQIIWQIWGLTPGGSADYAHAKAEYHQIIAWLNAEQGEANDA